MQEIDDGRRPPGQRHHLLRPGGLRGHAQGRPARGRVPRPALRPRAAGRDHAGDRRFHLRFRHAARRPAGHPQLPRLPQIELHLRQPRRLPRHPERKAAPRRRHRQYRRDLRPRRLARRFEPHVCRRRAEARRRAADRGDLRVPDARRRRRSAPAARMGDIGHAIQTFAEARALLGGARFLRPRRRPRLPRAAQCPPLRPGRRRARRSSPA